MSREQESHRIDATVNCFLLPGTDGFVAIVTHDDVDHIGNYAYLQSAHDAKVTMHESKIVRLWPRHAREPKEETRSARPRLAVGQSKLPQTISSFGIAR